MNDVISSSITQAIEEKAGVDLGLEVSEVVESTQLVTIDTNNLPATVREIKTVAKENMQIDYELARTNLRQLLEEGMSAVSGAIQLARESESPRVYESTGAFIKTLAEINKDLLSLSETVCKSQPGSSLKGDSPQSQNAQTINNNVIHVGTSEDLSNLISQRMKEM